MESYMYKPVTSTHPHHTNVYLSISKDAHIVSIQGTLH